jgi:NADPH:quinone reductase-like Zn-dependent oxidoreductase
MKAIVHDSYKVDGLAPSEVEKPELADDGVVIRVRATSVNRVDWYLLTGTPWLARPISGFRKPRSPQLGGDFAGTVEAVGSETMDLRPGDDVFGVAGGAFGEYVGSARAVAIKPANLTFEEAAAVPIAGLTALQALRDKGRVQPGQKVLVNGASGGVGTFTVQVAKALGAEVTGVCSPGNVELVRSLGADRVVDYTREDFTQSGERYDLMVDVAGNRSWSACKRVLEPHAMLVIVGGPSHNRFLGPLGHIMGTRLAAVPSSQKTAFFVAKPNGPDLEYLGGLLEAGTIRVAVDRRYRFGEIADALRYIGEGHAKAKIVVTV